MIRTLRYHVAVASAIALAFGPWAWAQDPQPAKGDPPAPAQEAAPVRSATPPTRGQEVEAGHIRGQITRVEASVIVVKLNGSGKTVRLVLAEGLTVIGLSKGTFAEVDFGSYVGAVAVKLDAYSPIVRDSLSWLHKGFELRVIDESLRGIAVGHKKWDLTIDSIMAHGWVDDMEGRVISIKYGPTEEEETDVEVPRDVPVLKMSLADKSLIKLGAHVFAGTQRGADGKAVVGFIFVGKDGIVPPL